MCPVVVPPLTRFAGLLTTPEAVGFRDDRWACPAARISSVSTDKSVHEQVPDGLSLTDKGLVRWVSEVRRSVGPSCREVGAQRLRASAQARWDSRPRAGTAAGTKTNMGSSCAGLPAPGKPWS